VAGSATVGCHTGAVARPAARNEVERWFLGRGIPHFIEGYSVREDVLTRAVPFLAVVFVAEVFVTFGDRHRGWVQAGAFVATLALLLGAVAVVNRIRGRRPLALPDDVGAPEVALFVLAPPAAALAFANDPGAEALALLVANVLLLGLAYLATSYGIVPMLGWGVRQIGRQLDQIAAVIVRVLPFLLLFSAFLLLTTEMWQVADDLPSAYLVLVVGGMILIGSLFVVLVTRADIDALNTFTSWDEVRELCAGTPLESAELPRAGDGTDAVPDVPPLQRRARLNVSLVLFVSQSVQIALVSVAVFVFYLVFGLLTIRERTIATWIGVDAIADDDRLATFGLFGHDIVLTRQLLVVAAFVATFAGLQFAVQVVSDAEYRRQFASDMAVDVRQALAVRAAAAEVPTTAATADRQRAPRPRPRRAAPR
jgi:hypothetical protein